RVVENLPEGIEGQDGQAPDVEVGAQGERHGHEGRRQAVLPAPFPEDVELPAQGVGGAAQGVVARELVHVERDEAGGRERGADEDESEDSEGGASADGRGQASLPLEIAAWTVWSVFSMSDRSSSSCSRWLRPLPRMSL